MVSFSFPVCWKINASSVGLFSLSPHPPTLLTPSHLVLPEPQGNKKKRKSNVIRPKTEPASI